MEDFYAIDINSHVAFAAVYSRILNSCTGSDAGARKITGTCKHTEPRVPNRERKRLYTAKRK